MPFQSAYPGLEYPEHLTVWSWLFESPLTAGEHASRASKAVINSQTQEQITYAEVKQYAEELSTALVTDFGLAEGDKVLLFSPNTVWYPVAMHAVGRVGGIVGGTSPSSTVEELRHTLQTSGARFIFSANQCLHVAVKAAEEIGLPAHHIFLLDGEAQGTDMHRGVKQLIKRGREIRKTTGISPAYQIPHGRTSHQVCGFLSFTSGTTGKPKACMISHGNVIAQCLQMASVTASDTDKVLAVLPLYHITGLVHLLHLPIIRCVDVILMPKYSFQVMLEAITHFNLHELILAPPILNRLATDPIVDQFDLTCVHRFSSGAAPLAPKVLRLLQDRFPWTGFKQGYGMTESCSCLTVHGPSHYDYKYSGTVGTLLPNTEVKFVDENGNETDEGEIWAKGPQCAMGYLDNPDETAKVFGSDDWLRTGDLGKMLPNGCLLITGRLKEVIKVKGVGISPVELEELLLHHPAVRDVIVIGKPDSYAGERPYACIVPAEGVKPSQKLSDELIQLVQGKTQRSKWIKGVEYIQSVPRAANGKVLRRKPRMKLVDGDDTQKLAAKL